MKNERGITLIVLVVSILILIILIGVSLDMTVIKEDGILKQVLTRTQKQQDDIREEERKSNSALSAYEEEWGIS